MKPLAFAADAADSVWALNRTEAGAGVSGAVVPGTRLRHGEFQRAKADGRMWADHRFCTVSESGVPTATKKVCGTLCVPSESVMTSE